MTELSRSREHEFNSSKAGNRISTETGSLWQLIQRLERRPSVTELFPEAFRPGNGEGANPVSKDLFPKGSQPTSNARTK